MLLPLKDEHERDHWMDSNSTRIRRQGLRAGRRRRSVEKVAYKYLSRIFLYDSPNRLRYFSRVGFA